MQNATGPIALIGFVLLGVALFWARHLAYRDRPLSAEDPVKLMLSTAGWLCIILGITGPVLHGFLYLSPVGLLVVAVVAIMMMTRYRALERRAMLRCLSVAVQKGIPLSEATRAFASERTDELGLRANRLATALEAGMGLPQALAFSRTKLPVDALLAVRVGTESGAFTESMRRIAGEDPDLDFMLRSAYEKLLYLLWICLAIVGILTFILISIMPVYRRMFAEFGLRLPPATLTLLSIGDAVVNYWYWGLPVLMTLIALCIAGTLFYADVLPRGWPVVNWFTRRWDSALVMRVLALAVHQQWPLDKTVWRLARLYPSRAVRGRLTSAGRDVNNGEDWCLSLQRAGLLRRSDQAVLNAARRVGNLEWALDEMSASSLRRLVYRLRLVVSVAFPLIVFLFGMVVAFVVVSLFMPLIALIQGLS